MRHGAGDDVADLGLVHAACLAMIERSALVTTAFTVVGKQILHVRPGNTEPWSTPRTARRHRSDKLLLAAEDPPDEDEQLDTGTDGPAATTTCTSCSRTMLQRTRTLTA